MNDMKTTIGARIKSQMDKKGISVNDIAKALGVSYQAVYGYIKGKKLPTLLHFATVANVLGTTMDKLFRG